MCNGVSQMSVVWILGWLPLLCLGLLWNTVNELRNHADKCSRRRRNSGGISHPYQTIIRSIARSPPSPQWSKHYCTTSLNSNNLSDVNGIDDVAGVQWDPLCMMFGCYVEIILHGNMLEPYHARGFHKGPEKRGLLSVDVSVTLRTIAPISEYVYRANFVCIVDE